MISSQLYLPIVTSAMNVIYRARDLIFFGGLFDSARRVRHIQYPPSLTSTATLRWRFRAKLFIVVPTAVIWQLGFSTSYLHMQRASFFEPFANFNSPGQDMSPLFVIRSFAVWNFRNATVADSPFIWKNFSNNARSANDKLKKSNEKSSCITAFYYKINLDNSAESISCQRHLQVTFYTLFAAKKNRLPRGPCGISSN